MITSIELLKTITENTIIIISAWNYNSEIKIKILNYLKNNGFPIGFKLNFLNINPISLEHLILY